MAIPSPVPTQSTGVMRLASDECFFLVAVSRDSLQLLQTAPPPPFSPLSLPPQPAPSPRFSIIIDGGSTGTRAHIFAAGPDVRPDLACSAVMRVSSGLSSFAADPARAGESLRPLMEFARERVGGSGGTAAMEVRLMATAGPRLLEERVQEVILASCRDTLRASGFRFENAWAKVIPGSDEGIYAWVAANYALVVEKCDGSVSLRSAELLPSNIVFIGTSSS